MNTGKPFYYHRVSQHFYFCNSGPDIVYIEDIALALSNLCRFTGHLDEFYSVAQHSVLASYLVPSEFALEALLHDASEAYCNDIAAPLKALLPDYRGIEKWVEGLISQKFGTPETISPEVKQADLIMLATERRDLFIDDDTEWAILRGFSRRMNLRLILFCPARQESCLWSAGMSSVRKSDKSEKLKLMEEASRFRNAKERRLFWTDIVTILLSFLLLFILNIVLQK
ncbi:Uncharacterised protein [Klebsiella pneumoniae]|nr:Uncharacterised protein [Klebsiella pneumoniae]